MTQLIIGGVIVYLILGICYTIDFFYQEKDEGRNLGEFFVMTIVTAFLWPLIIVMNAVMDLRDER